MASGPATAPSWSRLTSAGSVFLFFAMTGGLWLSALAMWQLGRRDLAVILSGLGAIAPIVLTLGYVYTRPPLWVLRVAVDVETLSAAVRKAISDQNARIVAKDIGDGKGVFRRCGFVLRLSNPDSIVGWRASGATSSTGKFRVRSILYVQGKPKEAKTLDTFRDAVSRALAGTGARSSS